MISEEVSAKSISVPKERSERLRLDYLDGLRGLAALYVVMHHAYCEMNGRDSHSTIHGVIGSIAHTLAFGQIAVDVFIVLSGYCLMLPVARATDKKLSGGLKGFFLRRARRILPPYYAALFCSLIFIAIIPGLNQKNGTFWDQALPAFQSNVILSHFFLIHNLNLNWAFRIDYPMWSVATEWQIYFCFPVLLVIYRKFDLIPTLLVSGLVAWLLMLYFPPLSAARPYLLCLFALGMTGASLNFAEKYHAFRDRIPWGILSGVLAVLCCGFTRHSFPGFHYGQVGFEVLVGITTMSLLVYCTNWLTLIENRSVPKRPFILRLLESKGAVLLGIFSYSLYLIHAPLLAEANILMNGLNLQSNIRLLCMLAVDMPAVIILAYAFHWIFEKPFLRIQERKVPVIELTSSSHNQS